LKNSALWFLVLSLWSLTKQEMRKALGIVFLFFNILSTTDMTSQTICHVARSMRAVTFFHKMLDRGVIEQIGL